MSAAVTVRADGTVGLVDAGSAGETRVTLSPAEAQARGRLLVTLGEALIEAGVQASAMRRPPRPIEDLSETEPGGE